MPAAHTSVTSFRVDGSLYQQCTVFINGEEGADPRFWLNFFLFGNLVLTYLLPLLIMSAAYAAIVLKLRRRGNENKVNNGSSTHFIARQFTSPDSHRCAWIFVERVKR